MHEMEVRMTVEIHVPTEFYEASIALSAITRHPDLQVRALARFGDLQVRPDITRDYRALYEDDRDLGPPVVVEEIDAQGKPTGRLLLADGYHRYQALLELGRTEVLCRIYKGDVFTAILLAARENGGRGLQFSLNDRRKVVRQILLELAKRGITWPDTRIADWIKLDRATVARIREAVKNERGVEIPDEREVLRADGTVYRMKPAPERPPERERYDPNQGYQFDDLFDALPNADWYIPPPPPRQDQRRRNYRAPSGTSGRASNNHAQPPEKKIGSSLGRRDLEGAPSNATPVAPRELSMPPMRTLLALANEGDYALSYPFSGENGQREEAIASSQTMPLIPLALRRKLLHDLEVVQGIEHLLRDLGIVLNDEELQEKLRRFLHI
jgi:hypothetical protein